MTDATSPYLNLPRRSIAEVISQREQESLFSPLQITRMFAEYSKIKSIDPCGDAYPRLIAALNGMTQAQLRQIRDARIPWLWRLAMNRIPA